MPDTETIFARLQAEGLQLTEPRRVVIAAIAERTVPFTSAELQEAIEAEAPAIGRATVFRTLDLLCRLGIVQRIHEDAKGGRCHAYLACEPQHHHHLICTGCVCVVDFREDSALETLVRAVERRTAFRVEALRVELTGRCPACQAGEGEEKS